MNKIRVYRDGVGEIYLISEGELFAQLPSGAIHRTKIEPADWLIMVRRMELKKIGEFYDNFTQTVFVIVRGKLREGYQSGGSAVSIREDESRDAPSGERRGGLLSLGQGRYELQV